jgi:hypothetical protein
MREPKFTDRRGCHIPDFKMRASAKLARQYGTGSAIASLRDKVVLVTGAGGGIGKAAAQKMCCFCVCLGSFLLGYARNSMARQPLSVIWEEGHYSAILASC